jgi:Holliday junction DNA helicase RuvB
MEDFRIDIALGEGINARTINMQLKPFTLIGATTRTGLLSAPLRDRFVMREHLDFYTVDELAEIVRRNGGKLQVKITDDAALEIATRSRGTPRLANNRLRWVRDYATSKCDGRISRLVAEAALDMQGIDQHGLDAQDRKYLETIIVVFHGGPVGVEAVGHTMNLAIDTLVDEVEPYVLRTGLVVRTPRGRKVTAAGYEHLGLHPPDETGPGRLFSDEPPVAPHGGSRIRRLQRWKSHVVSPTPHPPGDCYKRELPSPIAGVGGEGKNPPAAQGSRIRTCWPVLRSVR